MLQSTLNIHKTERVDESFYFDKKSAYDLIIKFDQQFFQALAYSRDRMKFVMLAEFDQLDEQWDYKTILQQTDFLQRDYQRIICISNSAKFSMIPLALQNDQISDLNMELLHESTVHEMELKSKIPMLDAQVDFLLELQFVASLRNKFPHIQIIHQSAVVFNYINQLAFSGAAMFLLLDHDQLSVALVDEKLCVLYNQFSLSPEQDLAYYPLYIAELYQLQASHLPVFCMGRFAFEEEAWQKIKQQFPNAQLAPKDQRFQYAHRLEEPSYLSAMTPMFSALACE